LKNTNNSPKRKIRIFAGAFSALFLAFFLNEYIGYSLLKQLTNLSYSLRVFPPEVLLTTVQIKQSFASSLYMLYDLFLILIEIELFLLISKKINPPMKFGFLSLLLTLVGVLLLKFFYKAILLVFIKGTGSSNISLLYLFYSRQQVLIFLFFGFLLMFGYLTYAINKIKTLLENFPKEEENVTTKK